MFLLAYILKGERRGGGAGTSELRITKSDLLFMQYSVAASVFSFPFLHITGQPDIILPSLSSVCTQRFNVAAERELCLTIQDRVGLYHHPPRSRPPQTWAQAYVLHQHLHFRALPMFEVERNIYYQKWGKATRTDTHTAPAESYRDDSESDREQRRRKKHKRDRSRERRRSSRSPTSRRRRSRSPSKRHRRSREVG